MSTNIGFNEMALRHMVWANHKFFTEVAGLPAECLTATYGPSDWTVAHILKHMAGGFEWYNFLLTKAQWKDLEVPTTAADVLALRDYKDEMSEIFLAQSLMPNDDVSFEDEAGKIQTVTKAMVLNQAVYHSTEHRAHIATAIEVQGIVKIDLDSYDFWGFYETLKA